MYIIAMSSAVMIITLLFVSLDNNPKNKGEAKQSRCILYNGANLNNFSTMDRPYSSSVVLSCLPVSSPMKFAPLYVIFYFVLDRIGSNTHANSYITLLSPVIS